MTRVRVAVEGGGSGWLSDEDSKNPLVFLDPGDPSGLVLNPADGRKVVVPKTGLDSDQKLLVTQAILQSGYKFSYED